MYSYTFTALRHRPGTRRTGSVYLPFGLPRDRPAALQITWDGLRDCDPEVVEKLIAEGTIPPLVSIGSVSARYPATLPGGTDRTVRSPEYDGLGPSMPNLLIEEFLPALSEALGISFAESPDLHAITGCSSGGIAAWNACWERNDFFRRCYINSPTFSSFRGGDSFPFLIRKFETKPIRCYITAGTDDMRNSAGDWYLEAESAKEAMEYAGYEYAYERFQDGTHGAGNGDPAVYERALRFLWDGWATRPVSIRHLPPRVADLFAQGTAWEPVSAPVPYPIAAPKPPAVPADFPYPVSATALSSDQWRLYIATPSKRFVYAGAIQPDGTVVDLYTQAHLHVRDDFDVPGALDICVDSGDRLYAATELGIQTISQQGETNCILPLPGNRPAAKVFFGGPDGTTLYAQATDGTLYARPVLTRPAGPSITPPDTPPF